MLTTTTPNSRTELSLQPPTSSLPETRTIELRFLNLVHLGHSINDKILIRYEIIGPISYNTGLTTIFYNEIYKRLILLSTAPGIRVDKGGKCFSSTNLEKISESGLSFELSSPCPIVNTTLSTQN